MSPECLMPPSAMMGTSRPSSARAASSTAVSCAIPAPLTTRVVQIAPGPVPTLTASAPRSATALAPSKVPTLPITRSTPGKRSRTAPAAFMAPAEWAWAPSTTSASTPARTSSAARSRASPPAPIAAATRSRPSASLQARGWRMRFSRFFTGMRPWRRPSSVMGTPETWKRATTSRDPPGVAEGGRVTGSAITPLSRRFTRSTCAHCSAMARLLWITPRPPSRASAMASSDSVTVSMAELTTGRLRAMRREKRVRTSTSRGWTAE